MDYPENPRGRRALLSPLLAALLSLSGANAMAQRSPGQWVGDLYFVEIRGELGETTFSVLIDENDRIRGEIPSLRLAEAFPVPKELRKYPRTPCWRKGAMHQMAYGDRVEMDAARGDGRRATIWTFAVWEGGEWRGAGHCATGSRAALEAIPCDGGRYILVSTDPLMPSGDQGRTPFYVASLPEAPDAPKLESASDAPKPGSAPGALRLESAIDHGQDDLRPHMSSNECFGLAWHSWMAATDSHAVLVSPTTGLYWVFSLEKARLTKAGGLFKKVTPEMMAKGGFTDAVLCVNPEKQGTILVAAQDEDCFINNGDWFKELLEAMDGMADSRMDGGGGGDAEEMCRAFRELEEAMRPRVKQMRESCPLIVWYRIHPESGRAERLPVPPEGGAWLRNGPEDEVFRPMPDGSVKMGWEAPSLGERAREWRDGADGKADGPCAAAEAGPGPDGPDKGGERPHEGDGAA
jgi:hypothetical protein